MCCGSKKKFWFQKIVSNQLTYTFPFVSDYGKENKNTTGLKNF